MGDIIGKMERKQEIGGRKLKICEISLDTRF